MEEKNDSSKTKCTTCQSEIECGALKCMHCDSFQDWRRYITFSHSLVALIVALVSVMGLAIPVIVDTFHTPKSDIKISAESCNQASGGHLHFNLLVTNKGDRPGFIKDLTISFVMKDVNKNMDEVTRLIRTDNAGKVELLPINEYKIKSDAFYFVKSSIPNYFRHSGGNYTWDDLVKYSYQARILEFNGKEELLPINMTACSKSLQSDHDIERLIPSD